MTRFDPLAPMRRALFWAKEAAMGRETRRMMRQLQCDAMLSQAQRRAKQWAALQKVVRHAAQDVPLYGDLWRGVDIDGAVASTAAFAENIPILERETLAAAGERIVAEHAGRIRIAKDRTSGSTNAVMTFYSDRRRSGASSAARTLARRRLGMRVGTRELRLRGELVGEIAASRKDLASRAKKGALGAWGIRDISAVVRGPDDMDAICRLARSMRPQVIYSRGTYLMSLAEYVVSKGRQEAFSSVRWVTYSGSPVHKGGRRYIDQALDAALICDYACREMGMLAYTCPAGNLHLNEDTIHFETVDDDGRPIEGAPGHLVVTDLTCTGTPYVRYRVGDMCELAAPDEACSCGAPQRMLRSFVGRADNRIRRSDGTYLSPLVFELLLEPFTDVLHWQPRLGPHGRLRLLVECPPSRLAPIREELERGLRETAGPEFMCSIEAVDHIDPLPSGKYAQLVREPGWDDET